ncbi:MAG TPA: hypothetical protein VIS49_09350 [Cyclobacteriaceae bacterium]
MKKYQYLRAFGILLAVILFYSDHLLAQTTATPPPDPGITIYQYRRVPNDKVAEFIKRETTYWAEVAQKALAKGNLTFWALLEKQGEIDMEESSNFLFINTYKNIDAVGEVWGGAAAAFPNISMDKMETNSMSTVTSNIFVRSDGWQQAANAIPDKDFNFLRMIYHKTNSAADLIAMEKKHWAPFIKSAMDKNQTTQKGWGNARALSPLGPEMFSTVSYDLYSSLKEALNPTWDPNTVMPTEGLEAINKLETAERVQVVYRIVKAVNANQ